MLLQVANDRYESRGYATSIYEQVTDTRLPFVVPDFTGGSTPRGKYVEDVLSVYPNPMSEVLNIRHEKQSLKKVEIFNLSGEIVYKQKAYSSFVSLDLSSFYNGIYIIEIELADSSKEIRKFTKI